ncbi:FCD domain-containing protein [Streptosporangium soli]|nr:FCD domain-containing protein [Streptosporangium sp. KLBMP 9127]
MTTQGHPTQTALTLTDDERATLVSWASRSGRSLRVRSSIVLAFADGLTGKEVAARVEVSPATAGKWRDRFVEQGLEGLTDAPRPGRPRSADREEAERLINAAIEDARRGGTVPSTRSLARSLGLSQSTVARIWQEQHRDTPGAPGTAGVPGGALADRQAPADSLSRELLSDRVYALLRRWIVTGELVAGQRLVESEIARRLGTSQAPAREAIKRLAHEGLVSYLPHRGSYVAEISEQQAREVREVRVLLEEFAARGLAVRMRPHIRQQLDDDVQRMRRAAVQGDIGDFREADMSFHRHVAAACGNSFLPRVWRAIEPSLWGLHVVSNPLYSGDWTAMAEHHGDLLAALASGDPDEAARLFAAHARGAASRTPRRHLPVRRAVRERDGRAARVTWEPAAPPPAAEDEAVPPA